MSFNASIPLTVPSTGNKVMLTRDALYPLWGTTTVADPTVVGGTSYAVSYLMDSYSPINTSLRENFTCRVKELCAVRDQTGAGYGSTITDDTSPAQQTFAGTTNAFIGRDGSDVPWIFVPAGAHVGVSISANNWTTAWTAEVDFEVWAAPGDAQYYLKVTVSGGINLSGNSTVWSPTQPRWIRPTSAGFVNSATATAAAATPVIAVDVFCHNNAPTYTANGTIGSWAAVSALNTRPYFVPLTSSKEWNNSTLPWAATRLNAVAALFTNTTKVLNKEGTVLWGRLNPRLVNPYSSILADVETLHPAEKRYLPLETGCYVYNPPSTDLTVFTSYVQRAGFSGVSDQVPVFRLDNDAFVEVGHFVDPDGGTNMAVNLDYHIEFRTNSTLFNIGVSGATLESLHMAQIHLLKLGFFFKNDDHASLITRFIAGLAKLHPLLSVASPLAGGLLKAASVAVGRSTKKSRPNPTSASGSGITRTQSVTRRRGRRRRGRQGTVARGYATPVQRLDALDRAMANQQNPGRQRQGSIQIRLPSRIRSSLQV